MGETRTIWTTAFLTRICLGFAIAPLASIPIFVLAEWLKTGRINFGLASLLPTAAFAYGPTFAFLVVFGLPIGFFMVRFWRASLFDFAVLGALAGPLVVLLLYIISWVVSNNAELEASFTYSVVVKKVLIILLLSLLGTAESVLFWLIVRPDKLQRPIPQIQT